MQLVFQRNWAVPQLRGRLTIPGKYFVQSEPPLPCHSSPVTAKHNYSHRGFFFLRSRRQSVQHWGGVVDGQGNRDATSPGSREAGVPLSDGLVRLASVVVRAANQACLLDLVAMQVRCSLNSQKAFLLRSGLRFFFCFLACFVPALLSIFSWACDFFHCFSFRLSSQTKPDFLLGLGSSTVFVFFFVCVSPKLAALHRRRVSTVRGAVFFVLDCWQQTLNVLVSFCGAVGMKEGLTCTFCPHTSRLGHVLAASAS